MRNASGGGAGRARHGPRTRRRTPTRVSYRPTHDRVCDATAGGGFGVRFSTNTSVSSLFTRSSSTRLRLRRRTTIVVPTASVYCAPSVPHAEAICLTNSPVHPFSPSARSRSPLTPPPPFRMLLPSQHTVSPQSRRLANIAIYITFSHERTP